MTRRVLISPALLVFFLGVACGGGTSEPTVDNTVIASVSVTASATSIEPGATAQLTATAKNAAGVSLPGTATWKSSNQNIATVSSTGLVTGIAEGNATITATISGVDGTRGIAVGTITPVGDVLVEASGLTFNPTQVDITAGGQVTWSFNGEHNVQFTTGGAPANIPNTSTGSVSRTFNAAGSFQYFCGVHGTTMSGTVIVH